MVTVVKFITEYSGPCERGWSLVWVECEVVQRSVPHLEGNLGYWSGGENIHHPTPTTYRLASCASYVSVYVNICTVVTVHIQGVPGVKVSISGLNSRADSGSKTPYTQGSDWQRFRSYDF